MSVDEESIGEKRAYLSTTGDQVHNGSATMPRGLLRRTRNLVPPQHPGKGGFGGTDRRPQRADKHQLLHMATTGVSLQPISLIHKCHLNRKLSSEKSTDGRFFRCHRNAVTSRRP